MEQLQEAETVQLVFNPLAPEVMADPYQFLAGYRARHPIYRTPFGSWLVTRHKDVSSILRDRRFGRDFEREAISVHGPDAMQEPVQIAMSKMILFREPPDHTRVRNLVTKAFSVRQVEMMRARIESIARDLIKVMKQKHATDLVKDFAYPLPLAVICNMLGIPETDRDMFVRAFRVSSRALDVIPLTRREMDEANTQLEFVKQYFLELFERRRKEPGDDLLSLLILAEEAGDKLSNEELLSNVMLLFVAGHETTSNAIGNSLLALHRNPDQLRLLMEDYSLIPNAVRELLRYDSPVQLAARTALEDVVVDGVAIAKGDFVVLSLGAANRDPSAHDDPDRLNVCRQDPKPVSFGGGIHFCLGAQLAYLELEIALRTLFDELPKLTLLDEWNPVWRTSFVWRGLETLPGTFS